jgi:Uma2 family endonuclease
MTVDEFWDFCQREENQDLNCELIRGEIVHVKRNTHLQAFVCGKLSYHIGLYERRSRTGYTVGGSSGLVLAREPATVVGPHVAYFRPLGRWEKFPDYWSVDLPLLVIEVAASTDDLRRLDSKIPLYLEAGVPLVWVLNPEDKSVIVHRPGHSPDELKGFEVLTGGDELPGFACAVAHLYMLPYELHAVGA